MPASGSPFSSLAPWARWPATAGAASPRAPPRAGPPSCSPVGWATRRSWEPVSTRVPTEPCPPPDSGRRSVTRRSALTSKIESEVKLLQRHVAMLKAIMENQPIGIIRLSELLNFPQHKVRYSLRILEQEGLIKPSPEGAVTTDKLEEFLDYLKGVLDSMSSTVQELRKTLG